MVACRPGCPRLPGSWPTVPSQVRFAGRPPAALVGYAPGRHWTRSPCLRRARPGIAGIRPRGAGGLPVPDGELADAPADRSNHGCCAADRGLLRGRRSAGRASSIAAAHYDTGDYGPVYTRWDARSQAIITRADYIRRHRDCPSGSSALSQTESVSPGGPQGTWLVHDQIGGQQLTDYWFYVHRRWVFDLVLSNPGAVSLYRMSPQQYVKALGCAH